MMPVDGFLFQKSPEMKKDMKERLDVLLVNKGLAPSREKAKAMIMAGSVFVNNQREDKAGTKFDVTSDIRVTGEQLRYVSRGGFKLEKALSIFPILLEGKTCLDIGASTGGFTDCMLQNGAKKVYAIDVGYGQFAWKLRQDERVVCMERTNFRYMKEGDLPEPVDFASCDVSFISLTKVLPAAFELLSPDGTMVALIKPQFEAGKEKVGKKGVVTDKGVHGEVIEKVEQSAREVGFFVCGLSFSPIRGPEGNIEYLLYLSKREEDGAGVEGVPAISTVVGEAHETFSHHGE